MKYTLLKYFLVIFILIILSYFSNLKTYQHFQNKKKFAVMWANTENIGDDFQTLAAINLLKKNNINEFSYVNREKLSEYDGEPVVLIMNGWYIHDLSKFPPSNKITPIFISVHVWKDELVEQNIDYFKKHEPIGCRDLNTKKLFEKYNIKAYFSGCLTLCFDEYNNKEDKTYIVDLNGCNNGLLDNKTINLNTKYKNIEYIKQHCFLTHKDKNNLEYRLKKATMLLNKYKRAKIILTSRLHVSLPCRAFNTDVKFIHKNYNTDRRFTGLEKILNGGTKNIDNISAKIDRKIINKFKKDINTKFTNLIEKYK